MAKKIDAEWVVAMQGGSLIKCLRCGRTLGLVLPQPIDCWVAAINAFIKIHKYCKEQKSENTEGRIADVEQKGNQATGR